MNGRRGSLGALGAKTSGGVKYRDYAFEDGYTYRRYTDGSILILASPKGGAGTLVTQETHPDAWQAITAQIDAKRAQNAQVYLQAGTQVLTAVTTAIAPPPKRRKRRAGPAVVDAPAPAFNWVPWALGVGAVAALVAVSRRA